MGVAAQVLKLLRQPNNTTLLVVQALERVAIKRPLVTDPYLRAEVDVLKSIAGPSDDKEWSANVKNLRESALRLLEVTPDAPEQARDILTQIEDPGRLADFLASNLNIDAAEKQDLLEELQIGETRARRPGPNFQPGRDRADPTKIAAGRGSRNSPISNAAPICANR